MGNERALHQCLNEEASKEDDPIASALECHANCYSCAPGILVVRSEIGIIRLIRIISIPPGYAAHKCAQISMVAL